MSRQEPAFASGRCAAMTIATFGVPQKLNYVISIGLEPAERVVFLAFIALNRDLFDSQGHARCCRMDYAAYAAPRSNLPESKDIM
jgi:hypothetical protein